MTAAFIKILNMSITAGWITLAVMLLRLLLRKMPKQFTCMLWYLVGIRLVCPFSPKSMFSLIPSSETVPASLPSGAFPEINSGVAVIDRVVNPAARLSFSAFSTGRSGDGALAVITKGAVMIWLIGMCLMFCYLIFSYLHLYRKMRTAVLLPDPLKKYGAAAPQNTPPRRTYHGGIWQSEFVVSPFILGLIKPRIFIPFHISGEVLTHVLAHEQAHLARRDHLVKAFAFCLLSVYWFHPLLWAAYILFCRDIELACDERVVRSYGEEERKSYLLSLIGYDRKENCPKRLPILACPLAFGETDIRERILRVKTWKKPALIFAVPALAICAVAAFCLLTDPKEKLSYAPEPFGHPYQVDSLVYAAPQFDFSFQPETAPLYILASDYQLMESTDTPLGFDKDEGYWASCGSAEEIRLKNSDLENYMDAGMESFMKDISLRELVKENKKAWIVNRAAGNVPLFYYVMLQKNGDVYLTYGYDTPEVPLIRFIFRLSVLEEEMLSSDTLYSHRTKYIGDNSAVGNIIYNLYFPEDMTYRQFALQTGSEPYEVTVTFSMSEEDKEAYSAEATGRIKEMNLLHRNACIMFSLIENAGIINFKLIDETDEEKRPLTIVCTRQWALSETNCDLWHESKTNEQFEMLLIKLEELFPTDES